MTRTRRRVRGLLLALGCGLILCVPPLAPSAVGQTNPATGNPVAFAAAITVSASGGRVVPVSLTPGRSTVLETDFDVLRMAVADPAVADAVVVQPRQVLLTGKAAGTVNLLLWGRGDARAQLEVTVDSGRPGLQEEFRRLFPDEKMTIATVGDAVVLSGSASSAEVVRRAVEVATAAAPKAKVVNLLQAPRGTGARQVMLQVRIGEVRRDLLTEAGLSIFTGASGRKDVDGRVTTQQFASPVLDTGGTVQTQTFSDFLNLFLFSREYDIGVLLKALQTRGIFQSLAEPNLIAHDGQEASFLAGGEVPVPVVQGIANTVTIQYKEYGIRLNFTPTIDGDRVHLKVRPEVSALDYVNGVTLSGFRIPALSTRRAETQVELGDGQSFAIAGLLDELSQLTAGKVPVLGDIPILGALFRSKADRRSRTELLVIVTPRLIQPGVSPAEPPLPLDPSRFLPASPTSPAPKPSPSTTPPR